MKTENKETLVIGASENLERYSNKAMKMLKSHGHSVLALGNREGEVDGIKIHKSANENWKPHTVTLYLGPRNQPNIYPLIKKMHPRRVIFNPGTENPGFEKDLRDLGIETLEACTLVLLATDQF